MSYQDDKIVNCAIRMIEKMRSLPYRKLNDEYSKPVQVEIERMKNHCHHKHDENLGKYES